MIVSRRSARKSRAPALFSLGAAGLVWASACGDGSSSRHPRSRAPGNAVWVAGDASDASPIFGEGGDGAKASADGAPGASVDASADVVRQPAREAAADAQDEPQPDSATADRWFSDVTEAAGVSYLQATRLGCPSLDGGRCDSEAPRMTGGAAAGDIDGDGLVDLYVTRYDDRDLLLRNRGDGTFEDIAQASGIEAVMRTNGVGLADIDNDGDRDLYVTGLAQRRYSLYINDGAGHFAEEAASRGAEVLPGVFRQGFSVSFGDFDRDGYLDLHTCAWRPWENVPDKPPSTSRLLRNLGADGPGHFEDVTESAGVRLEGLSELGVFSFASSFSDMDHDGWPDLAIAADFGTSRLLWNDGDGTFTDGTVAAGVGTDENGMGSAIGDYDGDGRLDWFVTSIFDAKKTCDYSICTWGSSGNRLYRNNGDRTFSDRTDNAGVRDGFWGWGAAFFDYDNDGDLDLVMTNGVAFPVQSQEDAFESTPMRLWRNDGPGRMTEVSSELGLTDRGRGKGLLVLDYDNDGDLDLFVVNNGGPTRLYDNQRGNENDWLRVRLVGTRSNRDGLGARLTLRPGGGLPEMVREIRGGSQFLGQSETIAHFGLGSGDEPAVELTVEWPSGIVQRLRGLERNQTVVVVERDADAGALDAGAPDSSSTDGSAPADAAPRD